MKATFQFKHRCHLNITIIAIMKIKQSHKCLIFTIPDSKVRGANMGPTWVLSAPDGPHVGPMNLVINGENPYAWRDGLYIDRDPVVHSKPTRTLLRCAMACRKPDLSQCTHLLELLGGHYKWGSIRIMDRTIYLNVVVILRTCSLPRSDLDIKSQIG